MDKEKQTGGGPADVSPDETGFQSAGEPDSGGEPGHGWGDGAGAAAPVLTGPRSPGNIGKYATAP